MSINRAHIVLGGDWSLPTDFAVFTFTGVLGGPSDAGDSAANRRALVEIDDRADAVITVCDNDRESVSHVPRTRRTGASALPF
jgi:hypothetical protein